MDCFFYPKKEDGGLHIFTLGIRVAHSCARQIPPTPSAWFQPPPGLPGTTPSTNDTGPSTTTEGCRRPPPGLPCTAPPPTAQAHVQPLRATASMKINALAYKYVMQIPTTPLVRPRFIAGSYEITSRTIFSLKIGFTKKKCGLDIFPLGSTLHRPTQHH